MIVVIDVVQCTSFGYPFLSRDFPMEAALLASETNSRLAWPTLRLSNSVWVDSPEVS